MKHRRRQSSSGQSLRSLHAISRYFPRCKRVLGTAEFSIDDKFQFNFSFFLDRSYYGHFIHDLFNGTFSSSDYTASNCRMIDD